MSPFFRWLPTNRFALAQRSLPTAWQRLALVPIAALAFVGAPALAALNLPGQPARAAAHADGRPRTVTLITGDRVRVDAQGRLLAVEPGPGRRAVSFITSQQGKGLTVTPSDAAPLIRQGVVDPRLFNVSLLLNYGYDDAKRPTVPTIVRGIDGAASTSAAQSGRLRGLGMQTPKELRPIRAFAGGVDKRRATDFWNQLKTAGAGVKRGARLGTRVWLDGQRQMLLDQSVPLIGGPAAYAAGYTGKGITLAVLDSGLDATHPDFAGRIVASSNFTTEPDGDTVGHGTHVASIALGSGAASGGQYHGVAYEASLVVGKVCETYGCQESAMLAGMQWAAETQHARVINMSIGSTGTPDIDPLEEAVDTLSASTGVLFVVSAGNNDCTTAGTVLSPSTAQSALSVGATDKSDHIADFSSCGPRQGDYGVKPEIVAPGVNITAARSITAPASFPPVGPGGMYTTLSGTSMASPHAAGSAALVAQMHPEWNGQQIKAALMGSALQLPGLSPFVQGAGRIDLGAVIKQIAVATQPNAAFGVQLWPHSDDNLLKQTLIFSNTSARAQVLNLSTQAATTTGITAPPGMFYLSSNQITVPAGGATSVDLFANTNINVGDGAFAGEVMASNGSVSTKTLFSVFKEPESYNLKVTHLDNSGQPTSNFSSQLLGLDIPGSAYFGGSSDGAVSLRLQKGRYMLLSSIVTGTSDTAVLTAPEINLDHDTNLKAEASSAGLWQTAVPDPGASLLFRVVSAGHWNVPAANAILSFLSFDPLGTVRLGRIGAPAKLKDFAFNVASYLGHGDQYGTPLPGYPITDAFEAFPDVPVGYNKTFAARELAKVTTTVPPAAKGLYSGITMIPETPGADGLFVPTLGTAGGDPVVFYVSQGPTMGWTHQVFVNPNIPNWFLTESFSILEHPVQLYKGGREYVVERQAPGPYSPSNNPLWSGFENAPLPGQFFGDPSSKLPPMLRRPSTTDGTDLMLFNFSQYGPVDGSRGSVFLPTASPATLSLTSNGTVLGTANMAFASLITLPVPSIDGDYTLTLNVPDTGLLGQGLGLPKTSSTQWTFHSKAGVAQQWQTLPTSVIRVGKLIAPSAENVKKMRFGLKVLRQATPRPLADTVAQLSVNVSYDGGSSWRSALVTGGASGEWLVTADKPADGQTVSVQARAVSADGATVQQTLIDVFAAAP